MVYRIATIKKDNSSGEKIIVFDERTGKTFECEPESSLDHAAAIFSIIYLSLTMFFFLWLLVGVWTRECSILAAFGYPVEMSSNPVFRFFAFTFIGGALGGIVNGIRSFLIWHCELYVFGKQYLWKYITAPWIGAVLALFTLALVRTGVVAFSGGSTLAAAGTSQMLTTFGIGALTGYGSREVLIWLDSNAKRHFAVKPETNLAVPGLLGKTQHESEDILQKVGLKIGGVIKEVPEDSGNVGKVIHQAPLPNCSIQKNGLVYLTIGVRQGENLNHDSPPPGA